MIAYIIFLLFGSLKIRVNDRAEEFVTFITRDNLRFRTVKREENTFILLKRHGLAAQEYAKSNGIDITVLRESGLPKFFYAYRWRIGIYIGVVIFMLIVHISGKVVWKINVTGNNNISSSEIEDHLAELSFGVGKNFTSIDFDDLHRKYLINNDNISWISVNMKGTIANVEVRETLAPQTEMTENSELSNIVASENGKIVIVEAQEGKVCVLPGEYVAKGDLLIGCVMTSGDDRLRFERAKGKVLAEVNRSFSYSVSAVEQETEPTGNEIEEKELIFFKNDLKFYRNSRILYTVYDTIDTEKYLVLPKGIVLPVGVRITKYRELERKSRTLNQEELSSAAEKLFSQRLSETLSGAELLSFTREDRAGSDEYTVKCDLVCLADISSVQDIKSDFNEN